MPASWYTRLDCRPLTNIFDVAIAAAHLAQRAPHRGRSSLLAMAGPPGVGKSTAAAALARHLQARHNVRAVVAPMDGFHLHNAELDRLKLRRFKGRIDTFDLPKMRDHLLRIREGERVVWPTYDRIQHEPNWDGPAIPNNVDWVIVEGNYVLCRPDMASDLPDLFDVRWALDDSDEHLIERLFGRHVQSGRDPADARAHIDRVDLANAAVVRNSFGEADMVWTVEEARP